MSKTQKPFIKKPAPLLIISILILLFSLYLLGPKPPKPDFSSLIVRDQPDNLLSLDDSIKKSESSYPLKPDNEARIIWTKPYEKTPWSIVYLHGNGASQEEGDPIHEALAYRYGCNLFLARLADHGLQEKDPMLHISAEEWMQSALDAVMIGNAIGEKVIVVSTSTGSTLGLYLSSVFPELIDGHIMMSPNIDLSDKRSFILTQPFGLHMARRITGSEFYGWKAPGIAQQYWYTSYRIEGLITLKSMINHTMKKETFRKVDDPLLMVYYYRDEAHQDDVVSVERMLEMYEQLGTHNDKKIKVALSEVNTHIIGSDIFNSNLPAVWLSIVQFCEEVLKLTPVNNTDWQPFLDNR